MSHQHACVVPVGALPARRCCTTEPPPQSLGGAASQPAPPQQQSAHSVGAACCARMRTHAAHGRAAGLHRLAPASRALRASLGRGHRSCPGGRAGRRSRVQPPPPPGPGPGRRQAPHAHPRGLPPAWVGPEGGDPEGEGRRGSARPPQSRRPERCRSPHRQAPEARGRGAPHARSSTRGRRRAACSAVHPAPAGVCIATPRSTRALPAATLGRGGWRWAAGLWGSLAECRGLRVGDGVVGGGTCVVGVGVPGLRPRCRACDGRGGVLA